MALMLVRVDCFFALYKPMPGRMVLDINFHVHYGRGILMSGLWSGWRRVLSCLSVSLLA